MKNDPITMAAPCLMGLEGLVGGELKRMGAGDVTPENGRVFFSGDETMLARANLWTRYAERILILVGRFDALTFDELFEGTKALPWERWIGKNDAFPVKGSSVSSKLFSVSDCQSIIKKAVVDRLSSVYKIPWFDETGPARQIQFHIMKDSACLMIDTSGDGLHKRGYRKVGVAAPIKETLAAALCDLAIVKPDSRVYDPMCGSGTILIEAALKALNIAPGLKRSFACEGWGVIDRAVFTDERERAASLERKDVNFRAYGSDVDPAAIDVAQGNAAKAGVAGYIDFTAGDVADFRPEGERGVIICNPPYGERLMTVSDARRLYAAMGRAFRRDSGWSSSIITPDEQFEQFFGGKADKRRKLYNGMIRCQLYMYFKDAGTAGQRTPPPK